LHSAGNGISYNNSTGVISNAGVLSLNGNSGALTMDTAYISNFYLKARSLHSATSPITYNVTTGAIGISQSTTSTSGYLSSNDWNIFNNKLSSVDTTNISGFSTKVRSLFSSGSGISYNNLTGAIDNTGVLSLNGIAGTLTMDTGFISNFYLKSRALYSATSPITYNSITGGIGINQSSISTNGYLSSTDWNTFNNKQGAGNYITDPGGNGIMVRTALNTSAARTVTGTSNRVSVTNGDGSAGNPTIDISSSYAGQNTITTLGTVSTGIWNGTIITSAYGGTGNGFTKFTGPATSEKTFTLPNASATILTSNAAVTVAQGGTGQTTASAALNALLPTQTGNSGEFLTTNGTDANWTAITATGNNTTVLTSDVTNNNATANTIADVTGLSFSVTSGLTYKFKFFIAYTSAATTTGSRWSINGPTNTFLYYTSTYSLTATSITNNQGLSTYDVPAASNATSAATGSNVTVIEGIIKPSANGTVIARFASEVSGSAIVAKTGSYVEYKQIN
jgi:hypothetical protein